MATTPQAVENKRKVIVYIDAGIVVRLNLRLLSAALGGSGTLRPKDRRVSRVLALSLPAARGLHGWLGDEKHLLLLVEDVTSGDYESRCDLPMVIVPLTNPIPKWHNVSDLGGPMPAAIEGDEFKPGEKVLASGIYEVVHDPEHTGEHEVTCVYGEHFPPCNHCGHHPRFTLSRKAVHVKWSEHFKKG